MLAGTCTLRSVEVLPTKIEWTLKNMKSKMKFYKKGDAKVKGTALGQEASTQFFMAPKSASDGDVPD